MAARQEKEEKMNLFRKKRKCVIRQLSPWERQDRYNNSIYTREEQRFQLMNQAKLLEKKRKSGKEYIS